MSDLPPELRARLLRSVAAAPAPPTLSWGRRSAAAIVACAAWVLAAVTLIGPHGEGPRLATWYVLGVLVLVVGGGAALLGLGLGRGRYLVGPSVERLRWFALVPLASLVWVAMAAPESGSVSHPAWRCHSHGLLLGAPLLVVLLSLRRGLSTSTSALLGACLGACTGAWVHLILFAVCPDGGASHGVLGHVLPAVPLMAGGALLGHRWLRG